MPPLTDNQRESEVRRIRRELQTRHPHLGYRDALRMAERRVDERKHLRGSFR